MSPKSTTSNNSTAKEHDSDLNESTNQPNQTMQRHLNQLMHHQLLSASTNQQHALLSSSSTSNLATTTSNTPSSTASSITPPVANNLLHSSSFNTTNLTNTTTIPNSSSSLHDFHAHSSSLTAAAALASLQASPGHLLNRHFNQLNHLHRLGAHYPISLANQSNNLQTVNQSLIGHLQSNGQSLIDSTSNLTSSSSPITITTNSPSTNSAHHLYNINQLSQLSHYAQLGFLGNNSSMLNSLQLVNQQKQLQFNEQQGVKNEQQEDKNKRLATRDTSLNGSDEETCFTEDEDYAREDENMEINVASDDEDVRIKTENCLNKNYQNEIVVDEKASNNKADKSMKLDKSKLGSSGKKKMTKKLKVKDELRVDEELNVDEDDKESDENHCSKIDELLRNKDERRKIKLKPYKLISSNSILGSA